MYGDKTVREVALEQELKLARREIERLRWELEAAPLVLPKKNPEAVVMPLFTETLHLAATYDAGYSKKRPGSLEVIGRARCKSGEVRVAYYTDLAQYPDDQRARDILGRLHEDLLKNLAQEYFPLNADVEA
jgi:hypothetical protein